MISTRAKCSSKNSDLLIRFHPLFALARSRSGASSGPRWADYLLERPRQLIRRGGAPSGAAALLARGGVGATAPAIPSDPYGIYGTPLLLTGPAANPLPLVRSKRGSPSPPCAGRAGGYPPPPFSARPGRTPAQLPSFPGKPVPEKSLALVQSGHRIMPEGTVFYNERRCLCLTMSQE